MSRSDRNGISTDSDRHKGAATMHTSRASESPRGTDAPRNSELTVDVSEDDLTNRD